MARNIQLVIVASLAFFAGIGVDKYLSADKPVAQYQSIPSSSSNPILEKNYAAATQQIQQLKMQLAQYHASSASFQDVPQNTFSNAQSSIESQSALYSAESKLAEMRAGNYMKWITEQTKKSGNFNLQDEMQARFNVESVNPEWASTQEKKLTNLFIDKAELSGFALKETKCRTTQCQVSIGVGNLEQANLIVEKFSKLAAENKFMSVIAVPDIAAGNTTLYLSSAEQGFEFN